MHVTHKLVVVRLTKLTCWMVNPADSAVNETVAVCQSRTLICYHKLINNFVFVCADMAVSGYV